MQLLDNSELLGRSQQHSPFTVKTIFGRYGKEQEKASYKRFETLALRPMLWNIKLPV